MLVFEIILLGFVGLTLLPIAVVAVECLAGAIANSLQRPRSTSDAAAVNTRVAIVVPAHDEAAAIAGTVRHLLEHLRERDRLIVVADNCTDQTADRAREAGAEVVERRSDTERGKGYALAAGVDALRSDPPDVVVIVDADCTLEDDGIDRLACQVMQSMRPAQAAYIMSLPEKPTPRDAVSAFAFLFKNVVRPCGLAALRMPCLLTGTGMAFPWSVISRAHLATGDIVEDMRIGIEMALAGSPPMACPQARVWSALPDKRAAATTQRTRWEHGHLQSILRFVPRLLGAGLLRGKLSLLALAAELAVPPLSLLVVWMIVISMVSVAPPLLGESWLPLLMMAIGWGALALSVLIGWSAHGQRVISLGLLLTVPLYLAWKLPMYARFLVKPQKRWVRTARVSDTPSREKEPTA